MMIVQTVLTWYRQTWWVGTKEVLILLGFLVAAELESVCVDDAQVSHSI